MDGAFFKGQRTSSGARRGSPQKFSADLEKKVLTGRLVFGKLIGTLFRGGGAGRRASGGGKFFEIGRHLRNRQTSYQGGM